MHRLERLHLFDEHERAPELAVGVLIKRLAIPRRHYRQYPARHLPCSLRHQLAPDVCRHPHDIVHHSRRIPEDSLVYLLVDVADQHAALVVGGGVGFVDVADLARLGVKNLAVNLEPSGNLLKMLFAVKRHDDSC